MERESPRARLSQELGEKAPTPARLGLQGWQVPRGSGGTGGLWVVGVIPQHPSHSGIQERVCKALSHSWPSKKPSISLGGSVPL